MSKGLVKIANEKRIDWAAIRAEYIGGGTSYRALAEKYSVSFTSLKNRAKAEAWPEMRAKAEHKAVTLATQKIASAAADNATLAQDIKHRLLERLRRIEADYPRDATEIRLHDGGETVIYRIRDLTGACKDLTDDLPKVQDQADDPLTKLLARWDDAARE